MGLFDFFKKKKPVAETRKVEPVKTGYAKADKYCPYCGTGLNQSETVCHACKKDLNADRAISQSNQTVRTKYGDVGVSFSVSVPAAGTKEVGTFIKNGIRYKTIEERDTSGGCFTHSVAEYNEVLFFYKFMNKYETAPKPELAKESDFSRWYFMDYDIKSIRDLYKKICERGFYGPGENESVLRAMKVAEIKEVIAKLGLSIKGKKEDLISSLVNQADEYSLKTALNSSLYSITPAGKKWMSEHRDEYMYYTSEDSFSSLEAFKEYWATHDPDTVEMEKYLKEIRTDKESFGRYAYDGIIGLLDKKGGKEREILVCLGKELLIDLSGALSYKDWKDVFRWELEKSDHADIYFTPYLLRTIPKYMDYYDEGIVDEVFTLKLPMNVCTKDVYKEIIEMIFDRSVDNDTQKQYEKMLQDLAFKFAAEKRAKRR